MKSLFFLFALLCSVAHADWHTEMLSERPTIVVIENFLTPKECDYLIGLARPMLYRSTVVNEAGHGSGVLDTRRTSKGAFLVQYQRDKVVKAIDARLSELTNIPKANGESMQVLFYEKGAEYQPHYDFFNPTTSGGAEHLKRGGQRVATVIMYLNTPAQGGETIFPAAKVFVSPKKGNAVLFFNCLSTGEPDFATLHGGAPVIEGEKWIATKWFRMGKFE